MKYDFGLGSWAHPSGTRPDGPQGATGLRRLATGLGLIQFSALILFGYDLVVEWPGVRQLSGLHPATALHVLSETLGFALLILGFALSGRMLVRLTRQRDDLKVELRGLRQDFDAILNRQFADWGLTAAQRDVALLTVRGLKIAEIAAARGSSPGTVKAQMSAVFRAAGVGTRGELLGLVMDSFLDFSVEPVPLRPPPLSPQATGRARPPEAPPWSS